MRREEKRRKLHEALLNTLYPPPPQPEAREEDEEKPVSTSKEDFDVNLIPDNYGLQKESSSSTTHHDDDDDECGQSKLTRAQRKRLRKKKLKEDICRRAQIIGPLLPLLSIDSGAAVDVEQHTPDVRRNADGPSSNNNQGKKLRQRQRRKAKMLGKQKLNSEGTNVEICGKDNHPSF